MALVLESYCNYHRPLSFLAIIESGLRIGKLGTSSVRYEIDVFSSGDETIAADGHFFHLFMDRDTMRPTPIPTPMREALAPLAII